MMQPDKLFKEKLDPIQRPVPHHVWDTLEKRVHKKRLTSLISWKWSAAAVVLVALLIWSYASKDLQTENLTRNSEPRHEKNIPPKQSNTQPVKDHINATTKNPINSLTKTHAKVTHEGLQKDDTPSTGIASTADPVKAMPYDTIPEPAAKITEPSKQGIKLVFSAEEVNQKYLIHNPTNEATADIKKTSTWRKVLESAQELKTNQDPLGDLRLAKDEILARNFKK